MKSRSYCVIYDPISNKYLSWKGYDVQEWISPEVDPDGEQNVVNSALWSVKDHYKSVIEGSDGKLFPTPFLASSTKIGSYYIGTHSWVEQPFSRVAKRRLTDRIKLIEITSIESYSYSIELRKEEIETRYKNCRVSFPRQGKKFKTKLKPINQFISSVRQRPYYNVHQLAGKVDFLGSINGENFIFSLGEIGIDISETHKGWYTSNSLKKVSYFACAKESKEEPKFELVTLKIIDPISFKELTPENIEEYISK